MKSVVFALALLLPLASSTYGAQTNAEGEIIPAGEERMSAEIAALIRQSVLDNAGKEGRAHRDAHRKHHGCVKADFLVSENVPDSLRHGLFAESRSYAAWVRLSNGSGSSQDDREGDGRGFALKIMGVKGPKALDSPDEETQDFLMMNHPVFFVKNAEEYVSLQRAISAGRPWQFFLSPFRFFHEFQIVNEIKKKKVRNLLAVRYWNIVPSKLGNSAMKVSVVPCAGGRFVEGPESPNQLRENLEAQLASGSACFDFKVQLRARPESMPIEDPTVEWKEEDAPFTKVATILIQPQRPVQGEFCEALSFTPWHSLAEHRPLGGINRVRKVVYEEISRTRHDYNRQERREPRE